MKSKCHQHPDLKERGTNAKSLKAHQLDLPEEMVVVVPEVVSGGTGYAVTEKPVGTEGTVGTDSDGG